MLLKYICVYIALFASSSFAQTYSLTENSVEIEGHESKLPRISVASEEIVVNGTWNVSVTYQGADYSFPVQIGQFPKGSVQIEAVAIFFPSNSVNKYRGSFFVPTRNPAAFHLFFVLNDEKPLFVPMDWDGKAFSNEKGFGRITKARMTKVNDEHPFTFKAAVLAANATPRDIDGVSYFASPQTAVSDAGFAGTVKDGIVLTSFEMIHYTGGRITGGQGGVFNINDALTKPELAASPAIFLSQLNNAAEPIILGRWVKSAAMVSTQPFVLRFDHYEESLHMTIGEKEGSR